MATEFNQAKKPRVLSEQEIADLIDEGFTNEEIKAVMAPSSKAAAPKTPIDLNPLPLIGDMAKKAGNFMDIPAGFMRSAAYQGNVEGATGSKGYKQFTDSLTSLGQGEFSDALKKYGEALDTGLPHSTEYLKNKEQAPSLLPPKMQGKNLPDFTPSGVFKSMYNTAEGYPAVQEGIGALSDIAFDPLNFLPTGEIPALSKYNPDTKIGDLLEKVSKSAYKTPFIPIDTKMAQKGYNSFGDLAYDNNMWGSFGGLNKDLGKYIKSTNEESKRALRMLSDKELLTAETESLREPLYKQLYDERQGMALRKSPSHDKLVEDINYWTENYPRVEENNKIINKYRQEVLDYMKKAKENVDAPNISFKDGKLQVNTRPMPPLAPDMNVEELPIIHLNSRKSALNSVLSDRMFDETSNLVSSETKDNLKRIRDSFQNLEEEAISKHNPALGAQIKADNKDLSTAIGGQSYMNNKEYHSVLDIQKPHRLYTSALSKSIVPALTGIPIAFKKARESKLGGFVDGGLRRGIFNILGKLDNEDEQPPIPLRGK
jgi:hypothetical protein